ncbi:MAG: 2-amino-4-hydroxy-6-hydroxymethyldihydropteridine diphosphokinase [Kangiellaceae bacterium]|jgi:2-amino-4-hydroxy-6-hydroxymethyldihydropteridine diphosphokinase|nr:2-amino-4-hydroxy-6-hydroxymethyldihydropteridine diphosphokinase [Kangiellaceae bacterium]
MIQAVIGLGSNLDQPIEHVTNAIAELTAANDISNLTPSSLYRSSPMGPQDQNDYINAAAKFDTELAPIALLDLLQTIENNHGRVRIGERWGPRTLDLDLLMYGNKSIDLPRLKVPHYGIAERNFVLLPMLEILPNVVIPELGSINELVKAINKAGIEKLT